MSASKVAAAISGLDRDEIASALMLLKHRAGQLGLFKTMHALEPATQAVGYELAEHIEATQGLAAKDAAHRKRWHAAPPPPAPTTIQKGGMPHWPRRS